MIRLFYLLAAFIIAAPAFSQNPLLLKDIYPGATGSAPAEIVRTTGYTFFNAEDDDADADKGLYRTDGTTTGTIKLNLTDTTYISTIATKLTALGNKIIFAGDNLPYYGEIWVSDGTQAGTRALERFQPATFSSNVNSKVVNDIARLGSQVLYSVRSNNDHFLLKKTDGTPGAMSVVYDFGMVSNTNASVSLFSAVNNILYFIFYDGDSTDQLWRSDGTPAGTYLVKNFTSSRYVASSLMAAGNNFYIMLVEPGVGNVLWKSDGTTAGTVPLKTIGTTGNNNYPPNAAIGNTLYFAGLDNANGKELWKTDGTPAGTVLAADINPGTASSNPNWLTALNNNIYFSATAATTGNELWKYNDTAATLLKDIYPGTPGSIPASLAVSNNRIVFSALGDSTFGNELWITDGTSANTVMAAEIAGGAVSGAPALITAGNPVYFTASTTDAGRELYKYDNSLFTPHVLYVNDGSTTGDVLTAAAGNNANNGSQATPFATLEYAFRKIQNGDTLFIDAGNYPQPYPSWIINKSVTILGSNYLVSPNDGANPLLTNVARNAEAVISGGKYAIASDNITIKGFTVAAGADTAIILRDGAVTYNNITIQNNRFPVGGTSAISITGRTGANPANNNLNVLNNRFEKLDTLFGTSVFSSGVNNVNINDNAFVLNGGGYQRQSAVFIVGPSTGTQNVFRYERNYGDGVRIAFGQANRFNTGSILDNNFVNSQVGIQVNSGINQNTNFTIRGNKVLNFTDLGISFSRTAGINAGTNAVTIANNELSYDATGRTTAVGRLLSISHASTVVGANVVCNGNKLTAGGNFANVTSTGIAGIEIYPGPARKSVISNNEILFNGSNAGTVLSDSTPTLFPSGILVRTDGSAATMAANSELTLTNNAVHGFKQSVAFLDLVKGVGNTPAIGYGFIPGGAIVNINNNSFTGDSASINNGFTSQVVNANCNWYGSSNAGIVANKVSLTTVRYTPFLGSGTDADIAAGFQPTPGTCINLNGFSPAEAQAGAPVTFRGFGFTGVNTVQFNGVQAGSFNVVSDTVITAIVPAAAAAGTITISTATAAVTSANNFMVIPAATIDTVNICPGSNAVLLSNTAGATYQWKLLTDTGAINISNGASYSGVTSDTLRLLNVPTASTGNKYYCLVNGSSVSKQLVIRVSNNWNGGSQSDWNNPLNWGCSGNVPDINTSVIIKSGAVIINADASAKSVFASPGTTVTVGAGAQLIIKNQ